MNKIVILMYLSMVLCAEGKSTYTIHKTPTTYEEARKICQNEGGDLAVINSRAEEQELLELWKNAGHIVGSSGGYNQQAFIGINSLSAEGQWLTIDGKPVEYVSWSSTWCGVQQPDNPEQKCGSLLEKGGMDNFWCHLKLGFFCEIGNETENVEKLHFEYY